VTEREAARGRTVPAAHKCIKRVSAFIGTVFGFQFSVWRFSISFPVGIDSRQRIQEPC
jgi:hypothetical protein